MGAAGSDNYTAYPTWASLTDGKLYQLRQGLRRLPGSSHGRRREHRQFLRHRARGQRHVHLVPDLGLAADGKLDQLRQRLRLVRRRRSRRAAPAPPASTTWAPAGSDTYTSYPTWASLTGASYTSYASGFAAYQAAVTPGAGCTALANFVGTTGNENYTSYPTWASLTGSSYSSYATGFKRYQAAVKPGGSGTASLYFLNQTGNVNYTSYPAGAVLTAPGCTSLALGFTSYQAAVSTSGTSSATFYLPNPVASDTYTVQSGIGLLVAPGYTSYAAGFASYQSTPMPGASYTYSGIDFNDPRIVALQNFELPAIYAAYGLTASSGRLGPRGRHPRLGGADRPPSLGRACTSTAAPATPPCCRAGATWADVNALQTNARVTSDVQYWTQFNFDGYAMLDALLGVLNQTTGVRDQSGMMQLVAPGEYQHQEPQHLPFRRVRLPGADGRGAVGGGRLELAVAVDQQSRHRGRVHSRACTSGCGTTRLTTSG